MSNDAIEVENEIRNVVQEKRRVVEQIGALEQHVCTNESWLTKNTPATVEYQETLVELFTLQAYIGEIQSQVVTLDDIMLELMLERECWNHPDLLRVSSIYPLRGNNSRNRSHWSSLSIPGANF